MEAHSSVNSSRPLDVYLDRRLKGSRINVLTLNLHLHRDNRKWVAPVRAAFPACACKLRVQ